MTSERPLGTVRRWAATIRFRITALATFAVLVVLVAASLGLVAGERRLLTESLDEVLGRQLDEIATLVAAGRTRRTLTGLGGDDTVAQVVTSAGEVIAASPEAAGAAPFAGPPPPGRDEVRRTVGGLPSDDGDFRLVTRRAEGPGGPVVIHVAAALEDIEDSTDTLATLLTAVVPAVAAVLAALVWWLVGRTLRPVEAIRAEVAAIGGSDLHRRVPAPRSDDEIARLARTMNAMLDRVEDAAARQQRFVADASHELRSPLTRIRSEIEVDLAHPESADLAATHRSVLEETTGLGRLVDDLLHLARSDAGANSVRHQAVDLDDIVLREARRLRAGGRVGVDVSGVTAAQVGGDADQLTRVVRNLVDNAARHATAMVSVTLAEKDHNAVLTVTDDGPGIPPDQHDRVFERFTRLDDARGTATGGTGLGLAIARDILRRHGGTIVVDADHRPGARFVITIPL